MRLKYGIINPPKTTQVVSYDVTVTIGDVSKTVTLYSVVMGSDYFEVWNGLYPTSRTPINGNYIN